MKGGLGNLMKQAQEMQENMQKAQEEIAKLEVNGQSGGSFNPFGGYKQSGNGREWGAHGFAEFLEIKAVAGVEY